MYVQSIRIHGSIAIALTDYTIDIVPRSKDCRHISHVHYKRSTSREQHAFPIPFWVRGGWNRL